MKFLFIVILIGCFSCGSDTNVPRNPDVGVDSGLDTQPDTETQNPTKSEAAEQNGKSDEIDDLCEQFGWYGDGECDAFCVNPDCADCTDNALCVDPEPWTATDVSVLLPIDNPAELLGTVNLKDGTQHVLLNEALFDKLGREDDSPFLTETAGREEHYEELKILSVRFDPCVDGSNITVEDCELAVRVVMQPMVDDQEAPFDASIHLFFEFLPDEWASLLQAYSAFRTASTVPLNIHPAFGTDPNFRAKFNSLLVDHLTEDRVVQMTFMATGRSGNNWFWGGYKKSDSGTFVKMVSDNPSGFGFTQFGHDSNIEIVDIGDFPMLLLRNASIDAATETDYRAALERVAEIENPNVSSSLNTTCVGCHLSSETYAHAIERRPLDPFEAKSGSIPRPNAGKNMHAFSYFGDGPTVSPRVVRETARVVNFLNQDVED